jgi:hypothetical protein
MAKLVPYMLRGKGEERYTWYLAGNLDGLHRREDADLAVEVMELLQEGNVRAKGQKTYHLVISFHPEDRRLTSEELEDVVCRAVRAAGLEGHQYIAVRHSEQEHEHLHVAVNKIHPETLKIRHPYKAIHAYQALASDLEEELGLHRVDRTLGPTCQAGYGSESQRQQSSSLVTTVTMRSSISSGSPSNGSRGSASRCSDPRGHESDWRKWRRSEGWKFLKSVDANVAGCQPEAIKSQA